MAINLKFWQTKPKVQTPFQLVPGISASDMTRVQNYKKYWDFYLNKHFVYKRQPGEVQTVINYCAVLIEKSVQFLVGKPFTIEDDDLKDLELINQVWKGNDDSTIQTLKAIEAAQMGGITGDVWIKPIYDEATKWYKLIVLNSLYCYPELDEHDFNKVNKFKIVYPIGQPEEMRYFREEITPEKIEQFDGDNKIKSFPNILGEIGVVHIPNLPVAGSYYGKSDIQDIVDLQVEYNEKMSDTSSAIDYGASPITAIFGAKAKQLEKGANRVWSGLPKDARIENVAGVGDMAATLRFLEILKLSFHELSQVPENTLGKFQPISNTSGVALHMLYLPLIEKTEIKRMTYGKGFQELNRLILMLRSIKEQVKVSLSPTKVVFAEPLPKDKLIERQLIAQDVGIGIESKEGAMKRIGKTDEEIAETKRQLMEDKQEELALMYGQAEVEAGTKKKNKNGKKVKKVKTGFEEQ